VELDEPGVELKAERRETNRLQPERVYTSQMSAEQFVKGQNVKLRITLTRVASAGTVGVVSEVLGRDVWVVFPGDNSIRLNVTDIEPL
jgi:hypothetical protein